ncbi:membrane-spanning 4-domains subfamily A member 13 isoform X3 [Mustela putorius furo]|uniref:Membrane-spanning 4-domains subfamily A member 13 isoform X3 n=1 Tax=Mustela putorius furo TaxID=9669 RepID=A0A8U0ULY1_MUSPF|nr:membrane-spanning 4-domains subfamily A member 13 isoform X3 [Mustela putorius furo]
MARCVCSKLSAADSLTLGAVQIMIGIFHVFMWYFLLILYMGQIRGVFGTYEPITYKAGCSLWGVIFIITGVSIIRAVRHQTQGVKLGREVSRILLISYPLEFSIALTYSIFGCIDLNHHDEDTLTAVTEEAESTF